MRTTRAACSSSARTISSRSRSARARCRRASSPSRSRSLAAVRPVTLVHVRYVDCSLLRSAAVGLEVLALRRGPQGRSPGSWETVHGHIDPGETPVEAVLREVREETGLVPPRLYNVSRVEAFYRHATDEITLIPVFAGVVVVAAEPHCSPDHDFAPC